MAGSTQRLDAPDLNVRRIMQKRADGAPLTERDYKRLGQRQSAEEAVMRTGGAVNRSINPRAKTPFEQGAADRAYNDAYAAGRSPFAPAAPRAVPIAAKAPAGTTPANLATPAPSATPAAAPATPSPVTRVSGRYNGANLDPSAKPMAPGSDISIRGIDGTTKSWDGQKFANPAIAPAATAAAVPAGAPTSTTPAPTAATEPKATAPSTPAPIAASPDGDNEPTESPADAADEGPDDLPATKPSTPVATTPSPVSRRKINPYSVTLEPGQAAPAHLQTNPDPTDSVKKKLGNWWGEQKKRAIFTNFQT